MPKTVKNVITHKPLNLSVGTMANCLRHSADGQYLLPFQYYKSKIVVLRNKYFLNLRKPCFLF